MNKYFYLLGLAFSFILNAQLEAQTDGALDTTFGTNGFSIVDVAQNQVDLSEDVFVYPDGKILLVGKARLTGSNYSVGLVRLLADGTPDNSFGNQGIVTTSASTESSFALSVNVQEDQKIVVGGYAKKNQYDMMVIRYNSDGSLDTSFGDGGIKTIEIGGKSGIAEAMAIQEDGKIVLGGYASNDRFTLVRFNTDGSLDNSFGNNGIALYEPDYLAYIKSIDIQSDRKIIAGGFGFSNSLPTPMLVRFNEDGSIDNTFGENGKVSVRIGEGNDYINKIKVLENGNILAGGHTWIANIPVLQYDLALVMLKSDGTLDNTFGENGIAKTHILDAENYLFDIDVDSNGSILASGYATDASGSKMLVARYRPNGDLDTSFGENNTGYNLITLPNSNTYSSGMGIQPETGGIILGGYIYISESFNFSAARLKGANVSTNNISTTKDELVIWPNPVKDKLFIKTNFDLSKTSYTVYDSKGKQLKSNSFDNRNYISCSDLKSGIYFLKINNKGKEEIYKFIKK